MAHDDQFTAVGPSFTGSDFPRSGFSTKATDMVYGLNVQGNRCGVYGESVTEETGRESDVERVGVHGFGQSFGVFGSGNPGIAGVYGQNNRGRIGTIGAVMRGGTGVVGASLANLGNPLNTFQTVPSPSIGGSGIGVRGISGTGAGVLGESGSGPGVHGKSGSGFGVHGISDGGPGGVFESRSNAQMRLVAREMASPEGLVGGAGGELLATAAAGPTGPVFRLWFCTRSGDLVQARWDLVAGTRPFPGAPLSEGATGIDVKRIQMRLNMITGTQLNGDGELGAITREAVVAFQEREAIAQTGVVNADTWERLFALS